MTRVAWPQPWWMEIDGKVKVFPCSCLNDTTTFPKSKGSHFQYSSKSKSILLLIHVHCTDSPTFLAAELAHSFTKMSLGGNHFSLLESLCCDCGLYVGVFLVRLLTFPPLSLTGNKGNWFFSPIVSILFADLVISFPRETCFSCSIRCFSYLLL